MQQLGEGSSEPSPIEGIQQVLQLVDREVWVVTAGEGQHRGGLLATWVSAASIDPDRPALVIGVAPNHHTATLIDARGAFAAHLLSEDQVSLGLQFATSSGHQTDKFQDITTRPGPTGSPVLQHCLAWLDCKVYARLATGDRIYYWADVIAGKRLANGTPLREKKLLADASAQARALLRDSLMADLNIHRPAVARWRANLPAELRPNRPPGGGV